MSEGIVSHFQSSVVDGIALITMTSRELNQPMIAHEWSLQLRNLMATKPSNRYVIDFGKTEYMSSTAFAVVVIFNKEVAEAGGRVAVAELRPEVRIGADILCLGRILPIFADLKSALTALA